MVAMVYKPFHSAYNCAVTVMRTRRLGAEVIKVRPSVLPSTIVINVYHSNSSPLRDSAPCWLLVNIPDFAQ